MLVVDANVALAASARPETFAPFRGEELVAPPLLWPEARSALHVALVRGIVPREIAERTLEVIESGAIRERRHRRLSAESWQIADRLAWSKTYDAEYLALASLLGARLVTLDRRMWRAAEQLGIDVIAPPPP